MNIILYEQPNGAVEPVSFQYGTPFLGLDTIAAFSNIKTIRDVIREIKAQKNDWGPHLSQKGKFRIVNIRRNKYPITFEINNKSNLSHSRKGKISRFDVTTINGYAIKDWVNMHLRKKK